MLRAPENALVSHDLFEGAFALLPLRRILREKHDADSVVAEDFHVGAVVLHAES